MTGYKKRRRGTDETPGHPRETTSPSPGKGTLAKSIVLAAVLLGSIILRTREGRRVRRGARVDPRKGLRRKTRTRPIVWRRRRRRASRRRRQSRPSGRGRRAGQVPKGPHSHDRTGVRHGRTDTPPSRDSVALSLYSSGKIARRPASSWGGTQS